MLPHTIQIGPSVIKVRRPFFNLSQLLRYTQNLIFSAKIRKLIVWAFFHDVLSKMAREKIFSRRRTLRCVGGRDADVEWKTKANQSSYLFCVLQAWSKLSLIFEFICESLPKILLLWKCLSTHLTSDFSQPKWCCGWNKGRITIKHPFFIVIKGISCRLLMASTSKRQPGFNWHRRKWKFLIATEA